MPGKSNRAVKEEERHIKERMHCTRAVYVSIVMRLVTWIISRGRVDVTASADIVLTISKQSA